MAEKLMFFEGKFPAGMPVECQYATNHTWFRPAGECSRFGFTSYAIRLMQDVYFLDWVVNPGDAVTLLLQIGPIETSKTVSDLFAAVADKLATSNPELLQDLAPINLDGCGAGWLFEITGAIGELHNCKRGCLACSRVCPEQAIIFPDDKMPAINGAPSEKSAA